MHESEVAQSFPTPSDPMDSLPGSSIHGIFQARVLEWVAIAFSGYKGRGAQKRHIQMYERFSISEFCQDSNLQEAAIML